MKSRHSHIPFIWWVLSTFLIAALVYLLTRDLLITAMIGLADLGIKGLIFSVYRSREKKAGTISRTPSVIWLTGLPGAGKTTLGKEITRALQAKGLPVEHLDGDQVRQLFPHTGFSREERDRHIRRVGYLASRLERHGIFVVASFISPYRESREFVRRHCTRYIEVYLSTPAEVCEQRDPKGLYEKARKGEIEHFTGVNDPYEVPEFPDLSIDMSETVPEAAAARVMELLFPAAGKKKNHNPVPPYKPEPHDQP